MRNVVVSNGLYAALREGAARKGLTVNELAAEIIHAVVGDGPPPAQAESKLALQAQLLIVLW
ncbi:MAG TPA: hypothetical protein VK756_05380 [Solirubrobacteraceae bacterium]|nr:hypothetical protein [Solirubrobacteraceae bacterium]